MERLQHDVPFCFSRQSWYGNGMNINHAVLTVNCVAAFLKAA